MADSVSNPERGLRERQAEAVRARLARTAADILMRGEEPTMRGVARESGVSERTIYRYYASFDELLEGVRPLLVGKTGIPLCGTADELPEYAAELYGTFEENRDLIDMLLFAPWLRPHYADSRTRNLRDLRALLDAAHPDAEPRERRAAASALRVLLSGGGWHYLRVGCGLGPREVVDHARWTIEQLRASLDR